EEHAAEINDTHVNSRYLPGAQLPLNIRATTNMAEAVEGASAVLIVAPSSAMRSVTHQLKANYRPEMLIIHATKGFETESLKRMSTVIAEELECEEGNIVVLSGPSHAEEVVRRCPTTVVVASLNQKAAEAAQALFM
ncbi:glycerol-3-phosphate dehydrogenase, partial [Escherichia coli]|nr:glycerol-3-phosphate dehydrogenase [Escherichia coli]